MKLQIRPWSLADFLIPAFIFSISLSLTFSCKSSDSEEKIVGGTVVRSNEALARHTVALVDAAEDNEEFCTGVLVADNVVLTAAHCFRTKREDVRIAFGTTIPRSPQDPKLFAIQKVVQHPEFNLKALDAYDRKIKKIADPNLIPNPGKPLHDLALVWIKGRAPEGFLPAQIAKTFSEGVVSTAVAYGCLSTECEEWSDRMRKVKMKHIRTFAEANLVVMFAGKDKGTCPGDSGGPDFVMGSQGPELLSLIDTGPESCEVGISVETLLEPYRDWITTTVKAS